MQINQLSTPISPPSSPLAYTYRCTSAMPATSPYSARQVWINTRSGIFHREARRWHGVTREGHFAAEHDALSAGFRAALR